MNLLTVCIQAAKAAGTYVLSHKPRRDEVDEHFAHDVKLKLDRESQLVAEKAIHTLFPQSIILGEEGSKSGEDGLEWVIDPIDGTVNFFHGIPWWCSSVAVRVNGEVMAGAVYAPEMNMLYSAELNGPAYLNDQAIQPSKITTMGKALVITGSEKEINPDDPPLATAQKLAPHVQKIRILGAAALDICQIANGAAALDICQIANGAADVFIQNGLYIWDIAAAGLIVRQAGGVYYQHSTAIAGRYACLAAANATLADAMVSLASNKSG